MTTPDSRETSPADRTPEEPASEERLLPQEAVVDLRARWEAVQQGFVDDPRSAVSDADRLVGEVLQLLSGTFEDQHRRLETQWNEGEPDTEDLRSALQRYRAFFNRLLSI